jgi:molecular chaperone DnaK (HSP70)
MMVTLLYLLAGEGELCTSLNPEEVVAEGLAIRGAVLSGISAGKLRDLLMMDCLAHTVGVMSWEKATSDRACTTVGDGGEKATKQWERVFDAVLRRGAPLPAQGTVRFPLAEASQRYVSLDIHEEIEEVRTNTKPTSEEGAVGNKPTSADSGRWEAAYSYHVLATVDVPVPPPLSGASAEDNSAVDVTFTMTSEGVLKFEVCRIGYPAQAAVATAEAKKAQEFSTAMLGLYGVLMIVAYILIKIAMSSFASSDGVSGDGSAGDKFEL